MSDNWVKSRFHGHQDGTFTIERIQDVEPILENNKALQSTPQRSDWGRHVASIPNVIIELWSNQDGVNLLALPQREFAAYVHKKLADPDWMWLRTA